MNYREVMRRALEEHDVITCCKLWEYVAPNMPQPTTDAEAFFIMHHACTQAENVSLRSRAYSHRWLLDHGYSSGLPDELKPKAERMYPKIVDAIGIACGSTSEAMRPLMPHVQGAMENVVLEHYADGIKDPKIIKPRMLEARKKVIKKLMDWADDKIRRQARDRR
jgi:hypothetical protein